MTDTRRVVRAWRRLDVTARHLPLALLLLAGPFLPGLSGHGTELGDLPTRPLDALAALVLALECLPLAFRRRWPGVCLALVAGGFALDQLRGYHTAAGTALPFVLISTGSRLERGRRTTAGLLTVAYVPLALAVARLGGDGETPEEFTTFYLLLAAAWAAGAWLRASRLAEAERREHIAVETRTAERTRIARELHDVVTHHVTAMVVQAEAARYLTAAPDRLEHSLSAVGDTGRQALADLRHLLDLLNPDSGPGKPTGRQEHEEPRTPAVGRVLTLVEQTRRAGQPVEFTEHGIPPTSTGSADLVAYRVVQEALTNALKYVTGVGFSYGCGTGKGRSPWRSIRMAVAHAARWSPVLDAAWKGCVLASRSWAVSSLPAWCRTVGSAYGPGYRRSAPCERADPRCGVR